MSAVADLLAELVRFPTQQGNAQRGPGNERALCEHLAPLLRARGADEIVVENAVRTDGSPLRYNQADTYLPDLLICRPELTERVLDAI